MNLTPSLKCLYLVIIPHSIILNMSHYSRSCTEIKQARELLALERRRRGSASTQPQKRRLFCNMKMEMEVMCWEDDVVRVGLSAAVTIYIIMRNHGWELPYHPLQVREPTHDYEAVIFMSRIMVFTDEVFADGGRCSVYRDLLLLLRLLHPVRWKPTPEVSHLRRLLSRGQDNIKLNNSLLKVHLEK